MLPSRRSVRHTTTATTPVPGTVHLAWNANAATDGTTGYNIYYTVNATAFTAGMKPPIPGTVNKVTGINTTTITISGLNPGTTYFFGATAFNAQNTESLLSNVVSFTEP